MKPKRKPYDSKKYNDTWMYRETPKREHMHCNYIAKDWYTYKFVKSREVKRNMAGGWTPISIEQMRSEIETSKNIRRELISLGRDYNQIPGLLKRKYNKGN